jgi:hypothetical protein
MRLLLPPAVPLPVAHVLVLSKADGVSITLQGSQLVPNVKKWQHLACKQVFDAVSPCYSNVTYLVEWHHPIMIRCPLQLPSMRNMVCHPIEHCAWILHCAVTVVAEQDVAVAVLMCFQAAGGILYGPCP